MPFTKTQSILRKALPSPVFEWLHRLATSLYYTKQGIADWWFYNKPRQTPDEKVRAFMIEEILPYTMVGRKGLVISFDLVVVIEQQGLRGCLVECGVARGGCSALMIRLSNIYRQTTKARRNAWLFDSFEGLPEPTEADGILRKPQGEDKSSWDLAKGYCLGTQEEVEKLLFNEFGFSRDKVHLVKGWFQDTLPRYREKVGDIAVLRIDGDWYESTKCVLENLYDNVVDGGYVILDDYALVGCRKAVDEFFAKEATCYLCDGTGMVLKSPVRLMGATYPEDDPWKGDEHFELCPLCYGIASRKCPDIVLDGRGGGWFKKGGTGDAQKR